jgi:hypothetical protein
MKCKLCGKEINPRDSHNGAPLVEGRVCSNCNYKVIMERLRLSDKAKKEKEATESVEVLGTGGPINITDHMNDFEKYAKEFEETFVLGKKPVRKEDPENKIKISNGEFTGEVESLSTLENTEQVNPVKTPEKEEVKTPEIKESKSAQESICNECTSDLFGEFGLKTVGDLKRFIGAHSDSDLLEEVFNSTNLEIGDFEIEEV